MNKKKLIGILVTVVIVLGIAIAATTYCVVNGENPIQLATDIFSSNEEQIIGKWQHESKATAYEFKADGTCISHVSILKAASNYTIDGNKLIMTDDVAEGTRDVYKISVNESRLTMTLIEIGGVEVPKEDQSTWVYKRVSKINTQRLDSILSDAAKESDKD